MKKEKQSNRSLIISILSIITCVVLLIGATMAWFTDTETNTGNRIQAGTLDAKLYKWTGDGEVDNTIDGDWTQITNETADNFIFGGLFENWQPGDTETIYLAVENAGSLDFDYNLDLVVEDESLADALQFKVVSAKSSIPTLDDEKYTTVSSVIEDKIVSAAPNGNLGSTEIEYIALTITLDESTGNTYQGDAFKMDLILTATQENQDDTVVKAYDIDDITGLTAADADKTVILMDDITDDEAKVIIPTNVNIDLNGYTLTVDLFSMETGDICTVDIVNGEIEATTMSVLIPNGTVNLDDMIGIIDENGTVTINASISTLNLTGTTKFTVPITIMNDTRVVVDTEDDCEVNIEADTTGVEIENTDSAGNAVIIGDGADNAVVDGVATCVVNDEVELRAAIANGDTNIKLIVTELSYGDYYIGIEETITIPSGTTLTIAGESYVEFAADATIENGANLIIEEDTTVDITDSVLTNNGTVVNNGVIDFWHWTWGYSPQIYNNATFTNNGVIRVSSTNASNFAGTEAIVGNGKIMFHISSDYSSYEFFNAVLTNLNEHTKQPIYLSAYDGYSSITVGADGTSVVIPEGLTLVVEEGATLIINKGVVYAESEIVMTLNGTLELYGAIKTSSSYSIESESSLTSIMYGTNGKLILGDSYSGLENIANLGNSQTVVTASTYSELKGYLENAIDEYIVVDTSFEITEALAINENETVVVGESVTLTINATLTVNGSIIGKDEEVDTANEPTIIIATYGSIVKTDMTDNTFGYNGYVNGSSTVYYNDDAKLDSGSTFTWSESQTVTGTGGSITTTFGARLWAETIDTAN